MLVCSLKLQVRVTDSILEVALLLVIEARLSWLVVLNALVDVMSLLFLRGFLGPATPSLIGIWHWIGQIQCLFEELILLSLALARRQTLKFSKKRTEKD